MTNANHPRSSMHHIAGTIGVGLLSLGLIVGITAFSVNKTAAEDTSAADTSKVDALSALITPATPGTFGLAGHDTTNETTGEVISADASGVDCVSRLDRILSPVILKFELGSDTINSEHVEILSHIGAEISACEDAYVMIAGHADGSGDDATNLAISWNRADSALDHLLAIGVDPQAVEGVGFGARAPLSQGSSEDEGADRRVDFRVLRRP